MSRRDMPTSIGAAILRELYDGAELGAIMACLAAR